VTMTDLARPARNRRAAYAYTFGAKAVSAPATDMDASDTTSVFFRRRTESASVVNRKPPARQPAKNDDAGRETSAGPAQLSAHSETTDVLDGRSHAQDPGGSAHGDLVFVPGGGHDEETTQCHSGSASVNAEMNTCCASKAQATATKTALSSYTAPVVQMHSSISRHQCTAQPRPALPRGSFPAGRDRERY
jgi:hypothetical protein